MNFTGCNQTSLNGVTSVECRNETVRYGITSCGHCGIKCVYSFIEITFIIGLLANLLVILTVLKDTRLRHPTFIGIATLAFSDLLFLTINLAVSFETVITTYLCISPAVISRPFYIINSVCWFSSNTHVALLAIIRFISLVNPVRVCTILRPLRVVCMSAAVWILGLILLGTLSVLITLRIITPGRSKEFVIIWWLIVYLFPLIVTVVLYVLKLCVVNKVISQSSKINRRLLRRMSTMVVMVIVMATLLPLPKLVYNCLRVAGAYQSAEFKAHFAGVSRLLYLINHFINPFMYSCVSKQFRRSLKEMILCSHVINEDTPTEDSSVSSVEQRHVTMEIKHPASVKSVDVINENNNSNIRTISGITPF